MAGRFASTARSTRLTVVLGRWLAAAFLVCLATGYYSHLSQEQPAWLTIGSRPVWLYQVTQGLHVTSGIASIPLLLAKLWSVYPQLLVWPPIRSVLHALERASIALFVSAFLVQVTIGLINTYQWYPWPFPFRQTHFWLAWVLFGSLLLHIAVKLPQIKEHWRRRDLVSDPAGSDSSDSDRWSRRGVMVLTGGAVAAVVLTTAGQSFGWLNGLNFFAPRKKQVGPQGVPINRTAEAAGITKSATMPDWHLSVSHGGSITAFSLADLEDMEQHEYNLPIACVEGWSQYANWRGVRLQDVMAAAGVPAGSVLRISSLEEQGFFRETLMPAGFVRDPQTLVALALNGSVLDIQHGYPARIIAPNRPGVLQTKWLKSVEAL